MKDSIDPVKTCGIGPTRDIVAIDQLWDAYAHNLDSGDADGVADLFTDDGGYILLYNNRKTQTLDPMGYSPNSATDGKGGKVGGERPPCVCAERALGPFACHIRDAPISSRRSCGAIW